MARKTIVYTVPVDPNNRDSGRSFLITEMPADRAERWATRAVLALAKAGMDLPEGATAAGMAALAVAGFKAMGGLDPDTLEPLLDEMFTCVQFQPSMPGAPLQKLLAGDNAQIEEVSTRYAIRMEVFKLHTGFSMAG